MLPASCHRKNGIRRAISSVRLEGVKAIIGKRQSAGYIRYCRSRITAMDRHGPENQVYECYGVVNRESERLLLDIGPRDPKGAPGQSVLY